MKANNLQTNLSIFVLESATLHNMIKGLQQTIEYQHNLKGKLEKIKSKNIYV